VPRGGGGAMGLLAVGGRGGGVYGRGVQRSRSSPLRGGGASGGGLTEAAATGGLERTGTAGGSGGVSSRFRREGGWGGGLWGVAGVR